MILFTNNTINGYFKEQIHSLTIIKDHEINLYTWGITLNLIKKDQKLLKEVVKKKLYNK